MDEQQAVRYEQIPLKVLGVNLNVSTVRRHGRGAHIVLLHGLGSTKEDFVDITQFTAFDGRPFIAFDAPGSGSTDCDDLSAVSIPFQVETAKAVLDQAGIHEFHLVGHSMGGLTALILAEELQGRVLSLVSIEGNLTLDDCFLSRQIVDWGEQDPKEFNNFLSGLLRKVSQHSVGLVAANLPSKINARAAHVISSSLLQLSGSDLLLPQLKALPVPRMYMYGAQSSAESHVAELTSTGVEVVEIPHSGHWPMYANPPVMWMRIAEFLDRSGALDAPKNGGSESGEAFDRRPKS